MPQDGSAFAGTIEIVFFDIGGVIYDDTVYARALQTALRTLGARFSDRAFDDAYRALRAAQFGSFRRQLAIRFIGPNADIDALEAEAAAHWSYPPESLCADARPCIEALAGRVRLGIIANQPSAVREAMRRDGLDRAFEVWGVSDDVGLEKPDPRLFGRALSIAGTDPASSVMVGDRLDNDVRPAKAVGMRAVWVLRGEAPDDPTAAQLAEADASIRSLTELPSLLGFA